MVSRIVFELLYELLVVARLSTATFLLAMGFYLQIIAETSRSPDAEPIPWQFRILPAFLGFFILHTAGRITIYPLPWQFSAAVLYLSLLTLLVKLFQFLLGYYGMKSPRERVPEFIREAVHVFTIRKEETNGEEQSRQRK